MSFVPCLLLFILKAENLFVWGDEEVVTSFNPTKDGGPKVRANLRKVEKGIPPRGSGGRLKGQGDVRFQGQARSWYHLCPYL